MSVTRLSLRNASILFIVAIIFSSCTVSQPLQFKGYENFEVTNITSDPKINADIKLHNPNPVGATIREMNITLSIDDKTMGMLGFDDKVRIKKKADFTLPVEFSTSLDQLGGVLSFGLKSFLSDEKIPVGITGTLTVQKFIFFRKTFAFDYTDEIDLKKVSGN
ncbi:MAG: LEA type 2 family protein [Chitinophagales bacterium]